MFQIVTAVVAIALTSLLALASLRYGGSILSDSAVRANAAALVNEAQQIGSAVVLASLDDPFQPISLARIPSIPVPPRAAAAGAGWQVDPSGVAYIALSQEAAPRVCAQLAGMGGLDDSVSWSGAASGAAALQAAGAMFGCVGDGNAQSYFVYRLN